MALNPINYRVNVSNPVEQAISGYQAQEDRQYITDQRRQQQAAQQQALLMQQQKAERQQQMRDELTALWQNGPTLEKVDELRNLYPEMKGLDKTYERLTEDQRTNKAGEIGMIISAIDSGDTEAAQNEIERQITALKNSGKNADVMRKQKQLEMLKTNPNGLKGALLMEGQAVTGGKFSDIYKQETGQQYQVLTENEKKALNLDPKGAFQIDSNGKISSIGGKGITINTGDQTKVGTIPPGYQLVQTEDGKYQMEVIPGGPVEQKAKEIATKQAKTAELKAMGQNVVLENVKNAIDLIESVRIPIVGVAASKLAPTFRQSRVDLQNIVKTIRGNIGFDRLQQMREASKTGGALGAVSERELNTLESVLGSLDLEQSETQLIKNLNTIKEIIEKDEKYRMRVSGRIEKNIEADEEIRNKVGTIEKKLNRPLTAEERNYLLKGVK